MKKLGRVSLRACSVPVAIKEYEDASISRKPPRGNLNVPLKLACLSQPIFGNAEGRDKIHVEPWIVSARNPADEDWHCLRFPVPSYDEGNPSAAHSGDSRDRWS